MYRLLIPAAALLLFNSACTKKQEPVEEAPVIVEEAKVDTEENGTDEAADANEEADEEADGEYEPQGVVERWNVGAEKVDCVGVSPMECLRIRRANHPEWENFYDDIEGFEWEEGQRYILEVDIIEVENPPADASSKRYHLVRQIFPSLEDDGQTTCTSNEDCGPEEMCAGPAGCDVPWTCQPHRPCTMDLRAFCSCEGETIRGSSTCPPAPYKHAGECAEAK